MNSIESLHQILSFGERREQAFSCLAAMSKADSQPVVATEQHLTLVLGKYLAAEITADDLEEWALFIDCRADIHAEAIEDYVYALANPSLMGEISEANIGKMLKLLIETVDQVDAIG
ncbi:hypothetical protein Q4508_09330 [Amphritea sp. 2_MG-2023]|uniref:hypothetical protein n=1 Tax=Amphritea TaxID=515417 RepID=UPI001C06B6B6|nr:MULTISPECIES: hypothetical protein [Amphritea]MBU2965605.1 hypothetical protein [Amphritea atlantica]MDO6418760.1 hypothetical protein [Amphritea sp. 2_MG-2023]